MSQPSLVKISLRVFVVALLILGYRERLCTAVASRVYARKNPVGEVGLLGLRVSPGRLSPPFVLSHSAYSVFLPHSVEAIELTAWGTPFGAVVAIDGRAVRPDVKSVPIRLLEGVDSTTIGITVTAGDQIRRDYQLTLVRSHRVPTWVKVRDDCPWTPRDSAGELVFRDRMWLFGGFTPALVSDVWSSADGNDWTPAGGIPSQFGVDCPVKFVHDGRMWVQCGDELWATGDGTDWEMVTNQAPWKDRYAAGGVTFRGRMWVMGGKTVGRLFNDVWSSGDGINWELETEHAAWSPRQPFDMLVVHDNRLWLLGGGVTVYHPFKAYNDIWVSDDGRTWSRHLDEAPWVPRIWSSATAYRNRLWVLAGFRSEPIQENLGDVWYSADGVEWRVLSGPPGWTPRHESSVFVFEDKLWLMGGAANGLQADVWYLDLSRLGFLTEPVAECFVGTEYAYRPKADFNASGKAIRYRLAEGPDWLAVDPVSGLIRGIPTEEGAVPLTVEGFDDAGETARQSFTVHVLPVP